jgi:hypothetical protein
MPLSTSASSALLDTPRKLGTGSLSHYNRQPLAPDTTRQLLGQELRGLVHYDDAELLPVIFKTNAVSDILVQRAMSALNAEEIDNSFLELERIINAKVSRESQMYGPLVCTTLLTPLLPSRLILVNLTGEDLKCDCHGRRSTEACTYMDTCAKPPFEGRWDSSSTRPAL